MREFASPFTLNATGVISAHLASNACGATPVKLAVANGTGTNAGRATLTVPATANLVNGVYTLSVKTDCGCYQTPVYSRCPPPSMPAPNGYSGDGGTGGEPVETCPAEAVCPC